MIKHVTSLVLAVTCAPTARAVDIMPAEVRSLATEAYIRHIANAGHHCCGCKVAALSGNALASSSGR